MNIKTVNEYLLGNETGKFFDVDIDQKKVYRFNNRQRLVVYNAPVIEDGKYTGFFVDFMEKGTVTNTEEKIKSFSTGNYLMLLFSMYLANGGKKFTHQDFLKMVKYVDLNSGKFFTKSGDWRRRVPSVNWAEVDAIEL